MSNNQDHPSSEQLHPDKESVAPTTRIWPFVIRYIAAKIWPSFSRAIAVVFFLGAFGYMVWRVFSSEIEKYFLNDPKGVSPLQISLGIIAFVIAAVMFSSVLEGGAAGTLRNLMGGAPGNPYASTIARLSRDMDKTREAIRELRSGYAPLVSDDEKAALLESLGASIRQEGGRQVLAEIRATISESTVLAEIKLSANGTLDRLKLERSRIARRANLNLFVGLVTTIAGVWLLLNYARELSIGGVGTTPSIGSISSPAVPRVNVAATSGNKVTPTVSTSDITTYVLLFLPRLSLVLLIEVFAYFFLGLYRASLVEVKYVQNEMTNVEMRAVALATCVALGERESTRDVLRSYGTIDRNAHLAEPESANLSAKDTMKLLDSLKQILGLVSKG